MEDTILFIAGGIWQKPFVEYLKSKGHNIAIVNPVKTDTTALADHHIVCDINNLDAINQQIAELKPIAITSDQSDVSTAIVSKLSNQWGLPCNRPDVIHRFTNKHAMFEFASSIGVPAPHTELIESIEDIKNFGHRTGYPIIIKPTDSTMSRGFRKFDSEEEISEDVLEASKKFSKTRQVIVQNFVPGNMVTMEGACSDGEHKTLATSIKNEYFKAGITSGVRYPADHHLPKSLIEQMILMNDKYVERSGMEFGLTHSEYIVNDNLQQFCLLEIGARGGGAGITNKIVPWVSGVNTYDILHNSLMGHKTIIKDIEPLNRSAHLRYYRQEDVSAEQAEEIKKVSGVSVFCHNFVGTQFMPDTNDCRYTMGIFLAENEEEMRKLEEKVNSVIA